MLKDQNPIFLISPDDSNQTIKIKPNCFNQEEIENITGNVYHLTKNIKIFDLFSPVLIVDKNYSCIINVLRILDKESNYSCKISDINSCIQKCHNVFGGNSSKIGLFFNKKGNQTLVMGFYFQSFVMSNELCLNLKKIPEIDLTKLNNKKFLVIDRKSFVGFVTDVEDIPVYTFSLIVNLITNSISILTVYYDIDEHLEIFIQYLNSKHYSIDLIDDQYCDKSFICSQILSANYDNFDCKLMEAFSIINYVLDNWRLDEIFLCFNGGKDCTLVLHLFYTLLSKFNLNEFERSKITFLYIKEDAPSESEIFLYQTALFYGATLVELDSSNGFIQSCFAFSKTYPKKIICLMGNRKTDHAPNTLQSFQQTDKTWPRFLRVFPIINFNYADVWKYIQKFNVPYCKLYSQGYTSIGSRKKTKKNELLRINGSDQFLHASELRDVLSERDFR